MNRCTRAGIDVTLRCNLRCSICFYRHKPWFNTPEDKSLAGAMGEVLAAKARGCNRILLVGQGEPMLWPFLEDFIKECKQVDMKTAIITNGVFPPARYEKMYSAGLNHLHISVHGIGENMDRIVEQDGAGARQLVTLNWLAQNKLPWRSNTTLQKMNFQELKNIVEFCGACGVRFFVFLGFLPHYEWGNRLKDVAVRSAELRPNIEAGLKVLLPAGIHTTVRYHPMCHISPEYRKYVVNARYVLYDPNEWEYGCLGLDDKAYWKKARDEFGGSVACRGKPCKECTHFMHCGGYNQTFANGFDGNDQVAIQEPIDQTPGFLHDQNPANLGEGPQ